MLSIDDDFSHPVESDQELRSEMDGQDGAVETFSEGG